MKLFLKKLTNVSITIIRRGDEDMKSNLKEKKKSFGNQCQKVGD